MERLNTDVSALNGTLQKTPEVLNTVGVNLASDVFLSAVDNLVSVVRPDSRVACVFVGINGGTWFNDLVNGSRQSSGQCS